MSQLGTEPLGDVEHQVTNTNNITTSYHPRTVLMLLLNIVSCYIVQWCFLVAKESLGGSDWGHSRERRVGTAMSGARHAGEIPVSLKPMSKHLHLWRNNNIRDVKSSHIYLHSALYNTYCITKILQCACRLYVLAQWTALLLFCLFTFMDELI